MVLDGILYSKTPSETGFLGRMPLKTNAEPLSHLKLEEKKPLDITFEHNFYD